MSQTKIILADEAEVVLTGSVLPGDPSTGWPDCVEDLRVQVFGVYITALLDLDHYKYFQKRFLEKFKRGGSMNNYAKMCFEAEKAKAIPIDEKDVPRLIQENPKDDALYMVEEGACLIGGYISEGRLARAWTEPELAGMLEDTWIFAKWHNYNEPEKIWYACPMWGPDTAIGKFGSLVEAMLCAVMYERGFTWTGEKFEKREAENEK